MRVSVVIPTYRRPEALGRCLDALAHQSRGPEEIIVVARREDTASQECASERDQSIRFVPIDVPIGKPGFVAALNAGIDASHGEIVCLTDDDAEPHSDWIARILATFESDPSIGAVGGRDWVYHGNRLEGGQATAVGTVSWWGRVIGKHHLGVGDPRDVAVLKGVNLSVRGELARQIGFDTRLRGRTTEHHSELGLCLRLLRMGFRIVYDPAIAVDHRPQPRLDEAREFSPRQAHDAAYNETLALLEHLSRTGRLAHLLWTTCVGTRTTPGFAQAARSRLRREDHQLQHLAGNLKGRALAIWTHLSSRGGRTPGRNRPWTSSENGSADTLRVLAIAHSPSAGARAQQLLEEIPHTQILEPSRSSRSTAPSAAWSVLRSRAKVLYLVDVGKTTVPAAVIGRLTRKRVIVDTGDATFALARSLGDRSRFGLAVVGAGEQLALRSAHEIVVRGRAHSAHVPRPSTHIPDLAPPGAAPAETHELRAALALQDAYVVGLVGSLILSPRLRISYGWDLIEALPRTDSSVLALIVGDGSGLEVLRQRAITLGVFDRCRFVGRVPAERISEYVSAMDVAISTQTNDLVGQVRTTAKLPLYLACGCPVLASHVGEAALLLGPLGWTLPYEGVLDRSYPARLADAIETWRLDPDGQAARRQAALALAASAFDPQVMRDGIAQVLDRVSG
jgi:GT2 family glycosyltransferase/glycosyltransferase involved in cell wall biosynthesis